MYLKLFLTHRLVRCALAILAITNAYSAHAVLETPATPAEIAMLPPYCQAKARQGTPAASEFEIAKWEQVVGGRLWGSLHHYCAGVNWLNRAYGSIGSARGHDLYQALIQFNYQLTAPPLDNPFVAKIYLSRANTLRLMKKYPDAVRDYNMALQVDPKLRKAYLEQADFFADLKQNAESLKIVIQGLRYLPGDKALQRRYIELGGKLPYPEPLEHPAAVEKDSVAAPQEAEPQGKAETPATTKQASDHATVVNETGSKSEEPQGTDTQKIGSPNNPWCRFCPD